MMRIDGAALLDQHSKATGCGGEMSHTQRHVNSADECDSDSNNVPDTGAGAVPQQASKGQSRREDG